MLSRNWLTGFGWVNEILSGLCLSGLMSGVYWCWSWKRYLDFAQKSSRGICCYLWPPLLGWRSGEKHQGCVVGKSLEVLVVVNLERRGTSWDWTFYFFRLFQQMFWESLLPRCRRHRGRHRDSPLAPRPAPVSFELEAFGEGDCLLVPKGGLSKTGQQ